MGLHGIVFELRTGEPSVFVFSDDDEEETTATFAPLSTVKEVFTMKRYEPKLSSPFAYCKHYILKMKKKYTKEA